MRRFRLYWGEHNVRTKDTAEELLTWAENCLHDTHANLFDGKEYICTVRAGELGSVTYAVNGNVVSRDDVISMCADTVVEPAYDDAWKVLSIVAEVRPKLDALDEVNRRRVVRRFDNIERIVTEYQEDVASYTGYGPPPISLSWNISFETVALREIARHIKGDITFTITSAVAQIELAVDL